MENQPWHEQDDQIPPEPPQPGFPTKGKELCLAAVLPLLSVLLCNCIIYGGFNLGFSGCSLGILGASVVYLLRSGKKPTLYGASLLMLSALILASFPRSNDGFVKFVMICFLLVAVNLGLCLTAGQNRYRPAGILSLLDAPITLFGKGIGGLGGSFRGLGDALRSMSGKNKTSTAVLLGLMIAIPILAVMIPLLISADAAFDSLLSLLPKFEFSEFFVSAWFGLLLAPVLYTRCAALVHSQAPRNDEKERKYMNQITIITAISAVCLVYLVYLLSQLAYFVGGFSGILPEEYSMAQYARRGFFEMAALCGINLGLIALAIGLVEKKPQAPLALRLLCLFIGLVTLFLVVTASAKMGMYIGSYGLTRLRALTEIIMVFLGSATALVCAWLFLPRLPYMKVVLLLAMVLGGIVSWVDVDTVVAKYNVEAYQSGQMDRVDVGYLSSLSNGAVPYLQELAEDNDPAIRALALEYLAYSHTEAADLRGWNYTTAQADQIIKQYQQEAGQ